MDWLDPMDGFLESEEGHWQLFALGCTSGPAMCASGVCLQIKSLAVRQANTKRAILAHLGSSAIFALCGDIVFMTPTYRYRRKEKST